MARKKKKQKKAANLVGPEVQKFRYQMGLTQEQLAARCQVIGLDISRGTLSQIEAQLRRVTDSELFHLSLVLGVATDRLFPEDWLQHRKRKRNWRVSKNGRKRGKRP